MDFKVFEEFLISHNIGYKKNEPLCEHTSFKIGGPADFFVVPCNEQQLCECLVILKQKEIPVFILGKGSNLLVSDNGIEGAVISLNELNEIKVEGSKITAGAGATLASVCIAAQKNSLSGLEFAFGIPGGVGGALFMNAGAYGGEMSQVVSLARYVTADGNIGEVSASQMELGYRTSVFKKGGMVITSVEFALSEDDGAEIKRKMDDFMERRRSKQPLEYPSAGSTFKRPEGYFAGALIEKNNLKGVSVGGAMVSEKHAGFVINFDNATADDVKHLMEKVKNTVLKADGVLLEPEVIFVGRG